MRRSIIIAAAVTTVVVLVAGITLWWTTDEPSGHTVTAEFTSTTGVYAGDPVTVLGVPVGTISSITPGPSGVKVVLSINSGVSLPADVDAAIISQSLVAGDRKSVV